MSIVPRTPSAIPLALAAALLAASLAGCITPDLDDLGPAAGDPGVAPAPVLPVGAAFTYAASGDVLAMLPFLEEFSLHVVAHHETGWTFATPNRDLAALHAIFREELWFLGDLDASTWSSTPNAFLDFPLYDGKTWTGDVLGEVHLTARAVDELTGAWGTAPGFAIEGTDADWEELRVSIEYVPSLGVFTRTSLGTDETTWLAFDLVGAGEAEEPSVLATLAGDAEAQVFAMIGAGVLPLGEERRTLTVAGSDDVVIASSIHPFSPCLVMACLPRNLALAEVFVDDPADRRVYHHRTLNGELVGWQRNDAQEGTWSITARGAGTVYVYITVAAITYTVFNAGEPT